MVARMIPSAIRCPEPALDRLGRDTGASLCLRRFVLREMVYVIVSHISFVW